jgi:hypothetical protein
MHAKAFGSVLLQQNIRDVFQGHCLQFRVELPICTENFQLENISKSLHTPRKQNVKVEGSVVDSDPVDP